VHGAKPLPEGTVGMTSIDLLLDAFARIRRGVEEAILALKPDQLAFRPDRGANPIGWLVWHLARVQDDHIAGLAHTEQVWATGQWAERFGLPPGTRETGYGHDSDQVAAVKPESAEVLLAYYDAVHEKTTRFVRTLTDEDFSRIVDDSWDPAVTLAVRLVSVISDNLQHAGQAAYVKGIIERGADEGNG
jgi:uncharacterized damage-inducible protein DinB